MRVSWIYRLNKEQLIAELQGRNLNCEGTVVELRQRYARKNPQDFIGKAEHPNGHDEEADLKQDLKHERYELIQRTLEETRNAGRSSTPTGDPPEIPPGENKVLDQIRKWNCHFEGRDVYSFLERVRELQASNGFTGEQLLQGAPELLRGEALQWRRHYASECRTWEEPEIRLRNFYLSSGERRNLTRQVTERVQKPNENIRSYCNALTTLMRRRGGYTLIEQLDNIYYNMKPELQLWVRREEITDVPQLIQRIEGYEDIAAKLREQERKTAINSASTRRRSHKRLPRIPGSFGKHAKGRLYSRGSLSQDFRYLVNVQINYETVLALVDPGAVSSFITPKTAMIGRNNVSDVGIQEISKDQQTRVDELIQYEKELFGSIQGPTPLIEYAIKVTESNPVKQRYWPHNPAMQQIIDKAVEEMLQEDVIQPSDSAWSFNIILAKKNDGKTRFCKNFQSINKISIKDAHPLPQVHATLNKLREAKYLTTIDLKNGYWQIPLSEESSLPYGLHSAPAAFMRLMNAVITPDLEPNVFCYLDDIVIITEDFEQHLQLISETFRRLRDAKLKPNSEKSHFCRKQLKYLGHVVDEEGLHTDPEKVRAITDLQPPTNLKELRRFSGLISWYRRFIPQVAKKTAHSVPKRRKSDQKS
ncbi:uncharacterized protein LOC107982016 [Nasonia vitripennis]|uniref:Reverse transcriptase domain-containing protein n=1 Tax=Nasonia vitripennis TaxID=7425 RepID=A0A7M7IUM7_NASVI|nr:uncharacterized protein LOC107982016 [Nasonia vitripennis]